MIFFYFYFYRRKVDSILVYDFVLKYVSFFVTISLITPAKTNSILKCLRTKAQMLTDRSERKRELGTCWNSELGTGQAKLAFSRMRINTIRLD